MKNRLKRLLTNPKAKVYFKDILIMHEGEKREYYIDPRTKRNEEGLNVIRPFAWLNGHYWYICFDCGQIHMSSNIGKIQSGCCMDIDCERHQYINGNHHMIKREAIILDDEDIEN